MTDGIAPSSEVFDLVVIGGGVMGMFTAWTAAQHGSRVAVLERGRVGDPATASYGRTRSYRRDYLDAGYARLADEAIRLWTEFEAATGTDVLVRCGCMNIAKSAVTPDLDTTYATLSTDVMTRLGMPVERVTTDDVTAKYPFLVADLADLDPVGGLVNLPAVTGALRAGLAETGTPVHEDTTVSAIERDGERLRISSSAGDFRRRVGGGHGRARHQRRARAVAGEHPAGADHQGPAQRREVLPPAGRPAAPVHLGRDAGDRLPRHRDLPAPDRRRPDRRGEDRLLQPAGHAGQRRRHDQHRQHRRFRRAVHAGHRRVRGHPGDGRRPVRLRPGGRRQLRARRRPGFDNVFVGVGWRGTGYKFAPWVGRVLFELALREGTVYDIGRFSPARFATSTSVVPEGELS